MKKLLITSTFVFFCLVVAFAQTPNDTISAEKVFGGYRFAQGDRYLNMNQLANAVKSNELAYQEIKSAQATQTFALILSYAGGFLIGYPLGTAIGGGDPNWALAGIGAGLVVIAIPLSNSAGNQAKAAVDTFNSGLQPVSFWDKTELNLSVSGAGVGLVFKF